MRCGDDDRIKDIYQAEGSRIAGDVTMGEGCSVWYNAVIRGDENSILIGRDTNIQDNAVIHAGPVSKVVIGDRVTIGHSAIVHGCKIGNDSLIGMGSIIMNNAVIGNDCIIGAGSIVTEHMIIPDGTVAFGNPARIIRSITEKEKEHNRANSDMYVSEGRRSKRNG